MLYLTRKVGEAIIINDEIKLTVVGIAGKIVKLGFQYPEHAKVLRQEIYDRIQKENEIAQQQVQDVGHAIQQMSSTLVASPSPMGDSLDLYVDTGTDSADYEPT